MDQPVSLLRCAVAVGRSDARLAMVDDPVRRAAFASSFRRLAMAVASREGAATTSFRLAVAVAGVDGDADRSARFASDILDAIAFLHGEHHPLSMTALRQAWDLSERSNTSLSTTLDSDSDLVSVALSRPSEDLGEIEEKAEDLSGSRVRRRLVALALPFALARHFGISAPIPVFLPPPEEGDSLEPGQRLAGAVLEAAAEIDRALSGAQGLWEQARRMLQAERIGGRASDAYAEGLVRPVLTPGDMVRTLDVTARGGAKILGRLVERGMFERLPANRLARQIVLCRPALALT